jgi:hypothetical protein
MNTNLALRIAALAAGTLLLANPAANAQMYKWIDKDGKVQYSDQPPPDSASKSGKVKIDTPPPSAAAASGSAKSWQEKDQEFNRRRVICKSYYQGLEQLKQVDTIYIDGVAYSKADVVAAQKIVEEKCHGLEKSSY